MPSQTDRQLAADALYRAFLVNFIAEIEARELLNGYGSDSDSEEDEDEDGISISSDASSLDNMDTSESESSDGQTAAMSYLDQMAELYSQRYPMERENLEASYISYFTNDDPVFHNNSNNSQMPVAEQVMIALYRFGHYGNAASAMKVALHFGIGFGTVHLVTTRKEKAKAWVEEKSLPAWRDGWLMVDGTLVPLFR
ncbi:hypothetical protein BYT27DRAFT_7220665 [Phlegmacium glaucopus]|nr:hypothetical protein BYT27DRAFT_7220665 [Phlegmacium glaucopus]